MAHAQARCSSARGSGDGEMGKPRKVALITGITGQMLHRPGPCTEEKRASCGNALAFTKVQKCAYFPYCLEMLPKTEKVETGVKACIWEAAANIVGREEDMDLIVDLESFLNVSLRVSKY